MTNSEKKSKRNGIISTLLFHMLLIFSFFFLGLKYQDPPPAEEGISINLGFSDIGMDNNNPDNIEKINEIPEKENTEKQVEKINNDLTQEIVDIDIKKPEENKENILKENENEIIEEIKPEINKKALYTGKKNNQKKSDGEFKDNGDQGSPKGYEESKKYTGGGIGEDGTAYQLKGRSVDYKAKPIYNIQIEGKVVVSITVDRDGKVIAAIPGIKGSTTLNKKLLQRAKSAALKTKFNAKIDAPKQQQGIIVYYFSLN